MLSQRIREFVRPMLEPGEEPVAAMPGFRPLSRSHAWLAVFPAVLFGFAVSSALGWPAWVGGGVGGGIGGGLAMFFDQRQARRDHDGRGLTVGLVVTDRRLFVLDMQVGVLMATPASVEFETPLTAITGIETEKMQGSGLKRAGAIIHIEGRPTLRVIPAKTDPFLQAVRGE